MTLCCFLGRTAFRSVAIIIAELPVLPMRLVILAGDDITVSGKTYESRFEVRSGLDPGEKLVGFIYGYIPGSRNVEGTRDHLRQSHISLRIHLFVKLQQTAGQLAGSGKVILSRRSGKGEEICGFFVPGVTEGNRPVAEKSIPCYKQ